MWYTFYNDRHKAICHMCKFKIVQTSNSNISKWHNGSSSACSTDKTRHFLVLQLESERYLGPIGTIL